MKYRIEVFGLAGYKYIFADDAINYFGMIDCSNKNIFETFNINYAFLYCKYMNDKVMGNNLKYEVRNIE